LSKVKVGKDWGPAEMEGGEQVDNLMQGASLLIMGVSQLPDRSRPFDAHDTVE
jgi:hypothetical protein